MSIIAIEGMMFRAHHGVYEEERILGNDFVVDVIITTVFTKASVSDDITRTINYETIYLICEAAMKKSSNLLENVADRIAMDIKYNYGFIKEMKVRVKKLHPPVKGRVEAAWVEVDGYYSKKCARCGRPMICYNDNSCWCHGTKLYRQTLEQMKTHYGNSCLCQECLQYFSE
ncbi:MAG TPA: dihydroneopterin aldolase [Bacteroidetes bacterium]|nr:dihydroneopterin aldolase [Bacteroidota bacterium]